MLAEELLAVIRKTGHFECRRRTAGLENFRYEAATVFNNLEIRARWVLSLERMHDDAEFGQTLNKFHAGRSATKTGPVGYVSESAEDHGHMSRLAAWKL